MNEDQRKHLEFIQHIITRMNTNSFQVKKMAITIITAFVAIFIAQQKPIFILISTIPTLIFWALDSYYLLQERKFRGLYNDVVNNTVSTFSMNIKAYNSKKNKRYNFFNVLLSDTIIPLYLLIGILLIITFLFLTL